MGSGPLGSWPLYIMSPWVQGPLYVRVPALLCGAIIPLWAVANFCLTPVLFFLKFLRCCMGRPGRAGGDFERESHILCIKIYFVHRTNPFLGIHHGEFWAQDHFGPGPIGLILEDSFGPCWAHSFGPIREYRP